MADAKIIQAIWVETFATMKRSQFYLRKRHNGCVSNLVSCLRSYPNHPHRAYDGQKMLSKQAAH